MRRDEKLLFVKESWHGNFKDAYGRDYIEAAIHKDGKANWRVSLWGNDDYGLELLDLTIEEAYNVYRKLKDYTTQQTFHDMGFVGA